MPFNPLTLAAQTEKIVCKRNLRKYDSFARLVDSEGHTAIYAWSSGCCLRCVYCWAPWSRDLPQRYGKFYSPREVLKILYTTAAQTKTDPKTTTVGLSGCESTIGKKYLLELIGLLDKSMFPRISLDTNGVLLGHDKRYVYELLMASSKLTFRISLKAGTPEGFEKITGAYGRFYELPFQAIRNLGELSSPLIPLSLWAMTDDRIMPAEERKILLAKLGKINSFLPEVLHEERICPYKRTLIRLKRAGVAINFTEEEYRFAAAVPF